MGGDHGHGHGAPYKIPDYKVYKVETVPELMAVKRALAGRGLKDPWLRNEVWRYNHATNKELFRSTFGRGMLWGFIAAVITTGIGYAMDTGHGHGHGHEKHEEEHKPEC